MVCASTSRLEKQPAKTTTKNRVAGIPTPHPRQPSLGSLNKCVYIIRIPDQNCGSRCPPLGKVFPRWLFSPAVHSSLGWPRSRTPPGPGAKAPRAAPSGSLAQRGTSLAAPGERGRGARTGAAGRGVGAEPATPAANYGAQGAGLCLTVAVARQRSPGAAS